MPSLARSVRVRCKQVRAVVLPLKGIPRAMPYAHPDGHGENWEVPSGESTTMFKKNIHIDTQVTGGSNGSWLSDSSSAYFIQLN